VIAGYPPTINRLSSAVTVAGIPNASFTPIGMTIDNARKNRINLICKRSNYYLNSIRILRKCA